MRQIRVSPLFWEMEKCGIEQKKMNAHPSRHTKSRHLRFRAGINDLSKGR